MWSSALALAPIAPGRFRVRYDASWFQGRGALGGLVAAHLAGACERTVDDPGRPLRTFTAHFVAPAQAGEAEVLATVERAGGYVSSLTARVVQDGRPVAFATATFARRRESFPDRVVDAMPRVTPASDTAPRAPRLNAPPFTQHVDIRFTEPEVMLSGREDARLVGWIRGTDPQPASTPYVTTLLDCFPPSIFVWFDRPRPCATVDLSYHFFLPPPLPDVPEDGHFLYALECTGVTDGYSEERGTMWTPDGRLLARVRQNIAVFR
jgi:acyl-CoA thioesterase